MYKFQYINQIINVVKYYKKLKMLMIQKMEIKIVKINTFMEILLLVRKLELIRVCL